MADKPFSLRDEGRRRLLQALYDHGACGRPELIRFTSLSRTTVSSLVSELVVNGVVEERDDLPSEAGPRAIGRPAVAVSMAPTAGYAVGIDIGHQHVRVAVCDMLGNTVAESATVREVDLTPHETLDLAAARVHEALDERHISPSAVIGLGLGIAAPVQGETGEIEAAGIMPGWVGVNPAAELERRTALPVGVTNDADAGALGERTYGAARGVDDLIYVRLSAGIGAGIVADGRPLHGCAGLAGELGHLRVSTDGPICRCGNRGCLETVASPVAVTRLLSQSWNRPVTWPDLLRLLDEGNPGACRAVADAGAYIGRAIAAAVNLLNPKLIVIGGDLAKGGELVLAPIRTAIARNALPPAARNATVVQGVLGEHAEVLGAATTVLADSPRILASRLGGAIDAHPQRASATSTGRSRYFDLKNSAVAVEADNDRPERN